MRMVGRIPFGEAHDRPSGLRLNKSGGNRGRESVPEVLAADVRLIHKHRRRDFEMVGENLGVIPGEAAVAFEDFGAHCGVNVEETREVGFGEAGVFEDEFEHRESGEARNVDRVALGLVSFDEFEEGFHVVALVGGQAVDLHEAVDQLDRVFMGDVVADRHGGHEPH